MVPDVSDSGVSRTILVGITVGVRKIVRVGMMDSVGDTVGTETTVSDGTGVFVGAAVGGVVGRGGVSIE